MGRSSGSTSNGSDQIGAADQQVELSTYNDTQEIRVDIWQTQDSMKSQPTTITEQLDPSDQLTLEFKNICAHVEVLPIKGEKSQPKEKQIMFDVSGGVRPGEVLALMGPSGSGKTSLLTIVGARTPSKMRLDGIVTFNNQQITKILKRKVGYVAQDDLMFPNLTVYETLVYAALLRLPQKMSKQEKLERVDKVIDVLGLSKVRNTIIGSAFRRGVSGGERKRVSVGHELLINPSLLLLDEPTSGLDSTTAMQLIILLNTLARAGRTVLTTIHQPSSRLYKLLDKTMLLAEGHVMYYGKSESALQWFSDQGLKCPYGMNIADFMLDLANGDFAEAEGGYSGTKDDIIKAYESQLAATSRRSFCMPMITSNTDTKQTTLERIQDDNTVRFAPPPPTASQSASKNNMSKRQMQKVKSFADEPLTFFQSCTSFFTNKKWGASYFEQVYYLLQRSVRARRFDSMNTDKFVQLFLVALIVGAVWWRVGQQETLISAQDVNGLIFFEILFMAFASMFAQIYTFPQEYAMMVKERQSGMYRLSSYYLARIIADLPLEWAYPFLYVTLVYFLCGLRLEAWAYFANVFLVLLVITISSSVGMFIGAAVMSLKRAQTIATVTMLLVMLVGGFYARNVPSWLSWIKYASFMFYSFKVGLAIEFIGRDYYDCGENEDVDNPSEECELVTDLQEGLNLPFDPQGPWVVSLMMLFVNLLVFRVACYIVLRIRTRK